MPAEESKPVDPAVVEAEEVLEGAVRDAKGKQAEVESDGDEEDDDDQQQQQQQQHAGSSSQSAADTTSSKKKKKKSKRKNIKDALSRVGVGGKSDQGSDQPALEKNNNLLNGLTPQQIQELLSLNPALAQEMAAATGTGATPEATASALSKLNLQEIMTGLASSGKNVKDMASYKFWATQPVPKFGENEGEIEEGPLRLQKLEDVPKEPSAMLAGFEWVTMDLEEPEQMTELYELLNGHYVEDAEAMFRFNYSVEILKWALMAPGWRKEWHVGVRAAQSRKLVAFISAIPVDLHVRKAQITCSEVNFICVHKKLRGKRLAPTLIKEVTRRSNLREIWQGVYTGGVVLPTPVSTTRYYHRPLNWQKLHDIGFSQLPPGSKPQYQVRRFQLPEKTATRGLRELREKDIDAARDLFNKYMARFELRPAYSREEFVHWFLPKKPDGAEQVIWTYVVENDKKEITDLFSFYSLESSIIGNQKYHTLRVAYLFYYATTAGLDEPFDKANLKTRLIGLIGDALILARQLKFDVFNALSLMDNALFLDHHKFGPGDGQLHYYLFNYRMNPIRGGVDKRNRLDEDHLSGIGLVML